MGSFRLRQTPKREKWLCVRVLQLAWPVWLLPTRSNNPNVPMHGPTMTTTHTHQLDSPAASSSCPSGSSWVVAMTSTIARRRAPPLPLPTSPTRWSTCPTITLSSPIPCAQTPVSGSSTRTRRRLWALLLLIASRLVLTTRVTPTSRPLAPSPVTRSPSPCSRTSSTPSSPTVTTALPLTPCTPPIWTICSRYSAPTMHHV